MKDEWTIYKSIENGHQNWHLILYRFFLYKTRENKKKFYFWLIKIFIALLIFSNVFLNTKERAEKVTII